MFNGLYGPVAQRIHPKQGHESASPGGGYFGMRDEVKDMDETIVLLQQSNNVKRRRFRTQLHRCLSVDRFTFLSRLPSTLQLGSGFGASRSFASRCLSVKLPLFWRIEGSSFSSRN
jgi:hypothetical protein